MLFFAHTGLTLGAAAAVDLVQSKRTNKAARWLPFHTLNIDLRMLMFGSMLPDLDKIIGIYLFPDISNGRIFLHTLLFFVLLAVAGVITYLRWHKTWGLALAAGTLTHLIMDSMWRHLDTLFWPFWKDSFPTQNSADWIENIFQSLLHDPSYYLPEITGGLILLWFGVWVIKNKRLGRLVATGRVKR